MGGLAQQDLDRSVVVFYLYKCFKLNYLFIYYFTFSPARQQKIHIMALFRK